MKKNERQTKFDDEVQNQLDRLLTKKGNLSRLDDFKIDSSNSEDVNLLMPLIQLFANRFAYIIINNKQLILTDSNAVDNFGEETGLASVCASQIKKIYPELNFVVDKHPKMHVMDILERSANRKKTNLITRPAQLANNSSSELNAMASLPLQPKDINADCYDQINKIALGVNDSALLGIYNDFLAHAFYPKFPCIGLILELQGGYNSELILLNSALYKHMMGPRFLHISCINHFDQLRERLNRPTLIFIDAPILVALGKKANALLSEYIVSDETTLKLSDAPAFKQPNYAQIVVLSKTEHDWPPELQPYVCTLEVASVSREIMNEAYEQLITQHGAAGLLSSYQKRADQLNKDHFKTRALSHSNALNIYHTKPLLRFLIERINQFAGKEISTLEFWSLFELGGEKSKKISHVHGGRELKQMIPSLIKTKINVSKSENSPIPKINPSSAMWKPSYVFPSLEICQQSIDQYIGISWSWGPNDAPLETQTLPNIQLGLDGILAKAIPLLDNIDKVE